MTKQEKIKEEWHKINSSIDVTKADHNGKLYFKEIPLNCLKENIENGNIKGDFENYYLPKSLEGIENNNGWIKIESEDDLPKETGYYWVKRGNEICSNYIIYPESYSPAFIKNLTHYQPMETPQPPIY